MDWPQKAQKPDRREGHKAPIGARKTGPAGQTIFAFFVAKMVL
jgi:hypothetical protein